MLIDIAIGTALCLGVYVHAKLVRRKAYKKGFIDGQAAQTQVEYTSHERHSTKPPPAEHPDQD